MSGKLSGRLVVLLLLLSASPGHSAQSTATKPIQDATVPGAVAVSFVLAPEGGRDLASGGLLRLERADGTSAPPLEVQVGEPEVEVRLPPDSTWRLRVQVPGYWAPEGALHIGSEARRVPVKLLPTGELRGKLVRPQSAGVLPDHLSVSLESPRANAHPRKVGGGRFTCPMANDGSWRCELPADLLDLVVRVEGFVPVYRWDVQVVARKVRDLGAMQLETGSSVAGWAVTEDGKPLPHGIEARLVPSAACGGDTHLAASIRQTADEEKLGEDGFFQFRGVAPGAYVVLVDAPGYATATLGPLEVSQAQETLERRPAVLRIPLDLVVEVDPPRDFQGRPWRLSAFRASEESGDFDRRALYDGNLSKEGQLVLHDQPPGLFLVTLQDADGNVFWRDTAWQVDTSEDAVRRIEIPWITVRGDVTLGEDPLPAKLWFGGRMGSRRIAVESDDEGHYEGILPEPGDWWVEIKSREKAVKAGLWVDVSADEKGVATADLALPDTEISGIVVGPDDRPVSGANLTIDDAGDGSVTASTGDDGRFLVRGLRPGEVQLVALGGAAPHASSAVVGTTLAEGAETGPIILRLIETRSVEGMVLAGGAPVAGAAVEAIPEGGGTGDTAGTDVTGRFVLDLRADARFADFEVAPPRGGLTAVRVDVSGEGRVVIDTGNDPGTVQLLLPEETAKGAHPLLRLFQNDVQVSGQTLSGWLRSNGMSLGLGDEARELALPRMAPGAYRVCFGEPGGEPPCTSGYLAPGGTLQLSLR